MGFTTSCFIRKSPYKLMYRLNELGYRLFGCELNEDLCIFTEPEYRLYSVEFFSNIPHPDETDSIDCGTNEDLFLALAALRDDTDKFQWFISPEGIWAYNKNNDSISVSPKWRKATVYELIEHFKTKEEQ
jgi:hypothetical protein|nr:MAG TPA_asm: hypothetical protein [Caudoviricetes sp.]